MQGRKYYVICEDNCKFESMTKEQIITAIMQAVNEGYVSNIDAGFITKIQEQNAGKALTFWIGTTAEYNAIPDDEKSPSCLYIKTDDTFESDVIAALVELEAVLNAYIENAPALAEIHVKVIEGTKVSCVDENGNEMQLVKSDGETFVYKVNSYGAYTINGVLAAGGQTTKKKLTVDVDARKQYKVELYCVEDVFQNNTWKAILYVCQKNVAPPAWEIGAEKDGFTIIGKMQDKDNNGNKAPLTLAGDSRIFQTLDRPMKSTAAQAGDSWENTDMRLVTMQEVKNLLDKQIGYEDAPILINALRTVKKSSTKINPDKIQLVTTYDEVFLLSVTETGAAQLDYWGEPYEYFKNGNKALLDTDVDYWTRDGGDSNFYSVTRIEDNTIQHTEAYATLEYDYIFAFCI